MDVNFIISELRKNKYIFRELLHNLEKELIVWKSSPQKWCLLEIICHLYDEEREDFKDRLKSTLEKPGEEFRKIDPAGWVTSRKYMNNNFDERLNSFLSERDHSIEYLLQLKNPEWDNYFEHHKFGKMTAKLFFTNWLAHDYLHIRQIIKLKYDFLSITTNEKLNYAGDW